MYVLTELEKQISYCRRSLDELTRIQKALMDGKPGVYLPAATKDLLITPFTLEALQNAGLQLIGGGERCTGIFVDYVE